MLVKYSNRFLLCIALLSVMSLVARVASAAHIPVTLEAASLGTSFAGESPVKAIDGTGLDGSEPPKHQGDLNLGDYVQFWNDVDGDMAKNFIIMNLNGVYDVDSLRFWNMNAQPTRVGRGVTRFNIAFSTTGAALVDFGAAQSFFPSIAPGTDGYEGELFAITPAIGSTYALLTFGDGTELAFEGTFGGDAWSGFSEIQLYANAIPEPATFSLLALSGLALVGLRRKRVSA